ncbi:hypothetical protein [Novosphingobium sp. KACC 22771]|uniref:hypothetical protein n=1 Tax=Novosphingobium sp. KACC 22771 TaxID=3025670 RepID=UPI00236692A8|nr:hypothetical protein [Novosphingobium sp. KACC 22771]WDF74953.1 hypothetical protein PQ467_18195 [Novosphingobium sp. KACC 22771]
MAPIGTADDKPAHEIAPELRLRDYIWRPRIAKAWWSVSLVWWAGFVQAQETGWLLDYYETALAGYLNVLFFPMTILMALGVPFAWAKLDCGDWVISPLPLPQDQQVPPRSVGGMRDPASDPLDPRSGLHWQRFNDSQ